ncbi:rhodanese-like domain-containing protein 7 [Selaginella moellendorffii]|uniref:rhodanese-like domain-containing protein 7 n=1 Tax=Selaginella moellendorffii TaxID=88036 RepID=UPI000D1C3058|nr:rhodanese-like domain-containing protein 7 [Selaginella moellendorffii]|eukprot:XP_002960403.2 rhodanese-like domain-containing protein 7 [Selaginella moellendorffii]
MLQGLSPCFTVLVNASTKDPSEDDEVTNKLASTKNLDDLTVVSFYKFADIPDYTTKRQSLVDVCGRLHVSGGIILAAEGINGSISGTKKAVAEVLESIQADARLANLRITRAPASYDEVGSDGAFRWNHVRVRLKKEVVPLGVPGLNPANKAGQYVKPSDWNELISDPETVVIDVRNSYETRIGSFKGALDPKTASFREFPDWVDKNLSLKGDRPCRIATFCTGGIRCEKATAFLLDRGFDEVYHLEGGILRYLEETQPAESLWQGECFVFDRRVSVEHSLVPGTYDLCYACKKPVNKQDMESTEWEAGVSCPHCFHHKSQREKDRARARQRQFDILSY